MKWQFPVKWPNTRPSIVLLMSASVPATSSASAKYQLLWEPLLKFFWEACFVFPRALASDFCYDLDLCSQGQAVRAFFFGMGFPNFVKITRGILIKHARKLHRQVAQDLIIVDLQLTYFRIYCVVSKLPIL